MKLNQGYFDYDYIFYKVQIINQIKSAVIVFSVYKNLQPGKLM